MLKNLRNEVNAVKKSVIKYYTFHRLSMGWLTQKKMATVGKMPKPNRFPKRTAMAWLSRVLLCSRLKRVLPPNSSVHMFLTKYKPEAFARAAQALGMFQQVNPVVQATPGSGLCLSALLGWASAPTHSFMGDIFCTNPLDGNGLSFFTKKTVVGSLYV